jgi:hypothetical protein
MIEAQHIVRPQGFDCPEIGYDEGGFVFISATNEQSFVNVSATTEHAVVDDWNRLFYNGPSRIDEAPQRAQDLPI